MDLFFLFLEFFILDVSALHYDVLLQKTVASQLFSPMEFVKGIE